MDYESDLVVWADEQATLLREGRLAELDHLNLAEEIEGLARQDRREVESRLRMLLAYLVKWRYQPALQSRIWLATIATQQEEIALLLEDSPSLRNHLKARWPDVYSRARRIAERETGIATLPDASPWTLEDALSVENAS